MRVSPMLQIGGTPAVIHYLLEQGLLDGDCMTGGYSQ
jgi:dihydroxyacid dehydratase/phosphogluconate dehydratase